MPAKIQELKQKIKNYQKNLSVASKSESISNNSNAGDTVITQLRLK